MCLFIINYIHEEKSIKIPFIFNSHLSEILQRKHLNDTLTVLCQAPGEAAYVILCFCFSM